MDERFVVYRDTKTGTGHRVDWMADVLACDKRARLDRERYVATLVGDMDEADLCRRKACFAPPPGADERRGGDG